MYNYKFILNRMHQDKRVKKRMMMGRRRRRKMRWFVVVIDKWLEAIKRQKGTENVWEIVWPKDVNDVVQLVDDNHYHNHHFNCSDFIVPSNCCKDEEMLELSSFLFELFFSSSWKYPPKSSSCWQQKGTWTHIGKSFGVAKNEEKRWR